jgi:hypothetical protein
VAEGEAKPGVAAGYRYAKEGIEVTERIFITPNFHLGEAAVSAAHPALVEPVPGRFVPNIVRLLFGVLQPLREHSGEPISINSGYRAERLNTALGGSSTSQHVRGEAIDFSMASIRGAFEALMLGRVPGFLPDHLGQVIYYPSRKFVHIAVPSTRYPHATFCVHEPRLGLNYAVIQTGVGPSEGTRALRRLIG